MFTNLGSGHESWCALGDGSEETPCLPHLIKNKIMLFLKSFFLIIGSMISNFSFEKNLESVERGGDCAGNAPDHEW